MVKALRRAILYIVANKRHMIISLASFLIVLLSVIFILWNVLFHDGDSSKTNTVTFSRVCSDVLIQGASKDIEANNLAGLQKTQNDIIRIKDYDKDQNCLFILVRYNLLRNDTVNGRIYLAMLKKVSIAGGYSKAFTTPTMTPKELEVTMVFVQERNALVKSQDKVNTDRVKTLDAAADTQANGVQ